MLLYEGKAKKIFSTENDNEFVVYYKDDATAFNGEKKAEISSKGILNNKISTIMFEELAKEEDIPTLLSTLQIEGRTEGHFGELGPKECEEVYRLACR